MLSETDSTVRIITSKEEDETSVDDTQPPIFDFNCHLSTVVGGKEITEGTVITNSFVRVAQAAQVEFRFSLGRRAPVVKVCSLSSLRHGFVTSNVS